MMDEIVTLEDGDEETAGDDAVETTPAESDDDSSEDSN